MILPGFGSEIRFGSSEIFGFDSVVDLGLNSEMKLVIFFFFSLTGSDSVNSFFPSSSQSPSVIGAGVSRF